MSFSGHLLSKGHVKPDPTMIDVVKELELPSNVTELRSVLGMDSYIGRFLPHLAHATAPLRALFAKETEWVWGPAKNTAFDNLKALIFSAERMALLNPRLRTIISADSSSYGLPAVPFQTQRNGERWSVAFAFPPLTKAGLRYAEVPKEALALASAAETFDESIREHEAVF